MPVKKTTDAVQIMYRRLYKGRPERIAALAQTEREMALGRKIRDLREAAGLSQAALAARIGSSKSAISRVEDADYDGHSMNTLRKIADALGQRLLVDFQPLSGRIKAVAGIRRRSASMARGKGRPARWALAEPGRKYAIELKK